MPSVTEIIITINFNISSLDEREHIDLGNKGKSISDNLLKRYFLSKVTTTMVVMIMSASHVLKVFLDSSSKTVL